MKKHRCTAHIEYDFFVESDNPDEARDEAILTLSDDIAKGIIPINHYELADGVPPLLMGVRIEGDEGEISPEAENAALRKERDAAKRENDALIRELLKEIDQNCGNCIHHDPKDVWTGNDHVRPCGEPVDNPYDFDHLLACDGWEWRGITDAPLRTRWAEDKELGRSGD